MGHTGPYVQLRPLAGGREWDAHPHHLRPLTPSQLLSALVADANARSRRQNWQHHSLREAEPPAPDRPEPADSSQTPSP
ncbi:hypothetical protein [Streptomyces sp. NPDC087437]|uniref:hypothetical protein n=1 Tax=Streptomyces sp. NPDC087437 TaxID=3365789 RepID=UPI0038091C1B